MKNVFTLAILIFFSTITHAQVNAYAKVTSISGPVVTVSNVNETFDRFEKGEAAIIMQMQDDVLGNTENNSNFGSIGSLNAAGTYQLVKITDVVREAPAGGGTVVTIRLNSYLLRSFSTGANSSLQIISYPTLGNGGNFTTSADIKALPWNGNVGGVIAFQVDGKLTLNHDINADGAGFRGAAKNSGDAGNCETVTYRTTANANNGSKGEGIYRVTNPLFAAGKGKLINGGGGGNSHNGGGGGGSNFTAGGEGGMGYGCSVKAGGLGGVSLSGFISGTRVFLGGGGGAGEANDGSNSAGGNGGGIIIIKAKEIATQGFGFPVYITANGQSAADAANDGAGGGGAGGSILFDVPVWKSSFWRQIAITANAGSGGNVDHLTTHGAGAGGGQGTVLFTTPVPTSYITVNTLNGSGGRNSYFGDYAQSGSGANNTGILSNSMSLLPVKLLYFRGAQSASGTNLQWNVTEVMEVNQFEIERSNDGQSFSSMAIVLPIDAAQAINGFRFTDKEENKSNTYYRLKIVEANGKITYSQVVFIAKAVQSHNSSSMTVYPNPAISQATIRVTAASDGAAVIRVLNMQGSAVANQSVQVNKGENNIGLNVSQISSGIYTVQLIADGASYYSRVIVSK